MIDPKAMKDLEDAYRAAFMEGAIRGKGRYGPTPQAELERHADRATVLMALVVQAMDIEDWRQRRVAQE